MCAKPTLGFPTRTAAVLSLRAEHKTTRQIAAAGINDGTKAAHNSLGDLTAREWLAYLSSHASREAFRIR